MTTEAIEIRVSAGTQCNGLALSILAAFTEGKEVSLSAIGPVPTSQAVKAVAVANRTLAPRGAMLVIVPSLVTRDIVDKDTHGPVPWVVCVMRLVDFISRGPGNG
jgi:stage V sporulation protein SpoVS